MKFTFTKISFILIGIFILFQTIVKSFNHGLTEVSYGLIVLSVIAIIFVTDKIIKKLKKEKK